MGQISTHTLTARLRKGDEKAFRIIYERYWEKLFHTCFYFTRSREDTEDMLMGIFSSLWNNRETAEINDLDAYLARAAKNQSLKFILRRQKQRRQLELLRARTEGHTPDSPELLLEYKELDSQLAGIVQGLPERTKTIFIMNREKGLTYPEIARKLDISIKTVEYHISKALALLGKYTLVTAAVTVLHIFF